MLQLEVTVDDLAFVDADAVVCPVSGTQHATTSLLRRLQLAAGGPLGRHLASAEPLPVGSAVVTGGGELTARLLVLAVVQDETEPASVRSVHRALLSALQRASAWQLERVAVPPFGLGAGNLDIDTSAEVMVRTILEHSRAATRFPASVLLVAEHEEEAEALRRAVTFQRAGGA